MKRDNISTIEVSKETNRKLMKHADKLGMRKYALAEKYILAGINKDDKGPKRRPPGW